MLTPPPQPEQRALTVKEWMAILTLAAIPVVNVIVWAVWAFNPKTHPSQRTYAQASLIVTAAISVLVLILCSLLAAFSGTLLNTLENLMPPGYQSY